MCRRFLSVLAVIGVAGLAACGSSSKKPPKLIYNNLQIAQQVRAGVAVQIQYITWDDDGPAGLATSSFFADIDGNLATTGDQVVIALARPNTDGANQSFNWNTGGVPPGVYNIMSVTTDDQFSIETTAPGKVTVYSFAITKPTADRTILAGATIDIDYSYNDPDSIPTTDAFADRDGNLGTTGDQFVIDAARPENGGSQTINWNTTGVDPGTYFLILVNSDGTQGSGQFNAAGRITVITVTGFSPADETTLLSTAYNLRITFSQSLTLTGAALNSSTIPISMGAGGIPGSYTLENGGTQVNFEPNSTVFDAGVTIDIDVRTNVFSSDAGTTSSASSEFDTSISPVFVTNTGDQVISVMDMATDPENPTEMDTLNLAPGDQPFYGLCASDGMLYLSQQRGAQAGWVTVYDTTTQVRVGQVDMPSMQGGQVNAAGLVLSPDETRLYCAGTERTFDEGPSFSRPFLSIINRATMTEIMRIQLNLPGEARAVALSRDGRWAYVANYFGDAIHVVDTLLMVEVDTDGVAGNGISPILTMEPFPSGIAVSSDDSTVYASHGASGEGPGDVVDVSTFNATTFVEGVPLFSMANAEGGTPNLLFDDIRGFLYAPRANIFVNGSADGLSIFTPFSPAETIVDTTLPGANNFVLRDVDKLWGTRYIVLADRGFDDGGIIVVDVDARQAAGTAATNVEAGDVATIPPSRY